MIPQSQKRPQSSCHRGACPTYRAPHTCGTSHRPRRWACALDNRFQHALRLSPRDVPHMPSTSGVWHVPSPEAMGVFARQPFLTRPAAVAEGRATHAKHLIRVARPIARGDGRVRQTTVSNTPCGCRRGTCHTYQAPHKCGTSHRPRRWACALDNRFQHALRLSPRDVPHRPSTSGVPFATARSTRNRDTATSISAEWTCMRVTRASAGPPLGQTKLSLLSGPKRLPFLGP